MAAFDRSDDRMTIEGAGRYQLNRAYDVLRHRTRRHILRSIEEHGTDEELGVERLVAESEGAHRTRIALYHVHLPKLTEAGYTEWDPDDRTVRRGATFDEIAPALSLLARNRHDRSGH